MVEGKDDVAFFLHLVRERTDATIDSYGGDNLRTELRALSDLRGIDSVRRIVVVHDADGDRESSMKKVWNGLLDAWERDVPQEGDSRVWDATSILRTLPEDQWVRGPEEREWKVWLVPEVGKGDLEAVIWEAAVDGTKRKCIEVFLECLGDHNRFQSLTKTRLMAYLAVQREPVVSVSHIPQLSPQKSGVDLAHPSLDWLRQRIASL